MDEGYGRPGELNKSPVCKIKRIKQPRNTIITCRWWTWLQHHNTGSTMILLGIYHSTNISRQWVTSMESDRTWKPFVSSSVKLFFMQWSMTWGGQEQTHRMKSWEKTEKPAEFLSMSSSETRRKFRMWSWWKVHWRKRNSIWDSCGKRGCGLRVVTISERLWAMKSLLFTLVFVKALRVSDCGKYVTLMQYNVPHPFERISTWLFSK